MLDPLLFLPVAGVFFTTRGWRLNYRFLISVLLSLGIAIVVGAAVLKDTNRVVFHLPVVFVGAAVWFWILYAVSLVFQKGRP